MIRKPESENHARWLLPRKEGSCKNRDPEPKQKTYAAGVRKHPDDPQTSGPCTLNPEALFNPISRDKKPNPKPKPYQDPPRAL